MKKSMLAALVVLPLSAIASTVVGNPNAGITVVDGAGVYVHSVKAYRCTSGFQVLAVDETLDQWDSAGLVFEAGNYCDVVVRLRWSPGLALEPVSVVGFDVLSIVGTGGAFEVELDESAGKAIIP